MTLYINGSVLPLIPTEIAACCNWLVNSVLHRSFLHSLNSLQAVEYQDVTQGGRKWRKVVENGMFYPLAMAGEFEPFVNFLLNFLKNLEMWGKMTIPPPRTAPSGLVNSDPFYKKL